MERGGVWCTSHFIRALGAHALVVEFADLGLLAGGEGEGVAGGERRGCGWLLG